MGFSTNASMLHFPAVFLNEQGARYWFNKGLEIEYGIFYIAQIAFATPGR